MSQHAEDKDFRLSFGLPALDNLLGGGLRPGSLTVVAGATGAGKTQLGLRWASHGRRQEGVRGGIVDLTSRGDSQNHVEYARGSADWAISTHPITDAFQPECFWSSLGALGDLVRPFGHARRRVTRSDVDPEAWDAWKRDLARVLRSMSAWTYGRLARGTRRFVFDGFEPVEQAAESIQFELFEYLYDRVIRQEDIWAAREVLRERFRDQEKQVLAHRYDENAAACVALYTTSEVMLDALLERPIEQGHVFATASTVILMGRVRSGGDFGRALCVVKHRGSACSDRIVPFKIGAGGLEFDDFAEPEP